MKKKNDFFLIFFQIYFENNNNRYKYLLSKLRQVQKSKSKSKNINYKEYYMSLENQMKVSEFLDWICILLNYNFRLASSKW